MYVTVSNVYEMTKTPTVSTRLCLKHEGTLGLYETVSNVLEGTLRKQRPNVSTVTLVSVWGNPISFKCYRQQCLRGDTEICGTLTTPCSVHTLVSLSLRGTLSSNVSEKDTVMCGTPACVLCMGEP